MSMCRVFSCVVGRGCLLWPVRSLGKTLLAFALLHFVLQGQIYLLLQVSLDFTHNNSHASQRWPLPQWPVLSLFKDPPWPQAHTSEHTALFFFGWEILVAVFPGSWASLCFIFLDLKAHKRPSQKKEVEKAHKHRCPICWQVFIRS